MNKTALRQRIRLFVSTQTTGGNFIGGSDARIIMGDDQEDLVRLWREKRGELPPPDFSQNLIVQLGSVTEELNRLWFERCTGQHVKDVQKRVRHPINKWMGGDA